MRSLSRGHWGFCADQHRWVGGEAEAHRQCGRGRRRLRRRATSRAGGSGGPPRRCRPAAAAAHPPSCALPSHNTPHSQRNSAWASRRSKEHTNRVCSCRRCSLMFPCGKGSLIAVEPFLSRGSSLQMCCSPITCHHTARLQQSQTMPADAPALSSACRESPSSPSSDCRRACQARSAACTFKQKVKSRFRCASMISATRSLSEPCTTEGALHKEG